ncbi:MAG: carbohydrate ABC transporter permease, partial [Spirochaetaceae bacterium]|nr:carbohydrate ABC transporter permease [Spirochaetaceae bacterium]
MKNRYERFIRGIMYIFLVACAFIALYPIIFAVMTSVKTPEEYVTNKLGFPSKITLDNYSYVWKNGNML